MKHIIIGTAGHVDHGKTCLTKALTGIDTDRLREEQKRGITIVIGFAQLVLPNGQTASIVDVPGHEKFIRNMLTGATGMDVVLLVVAADEGFMPQTWEHLDILSLLGIQSGIIVLTKCDAVDEELLELVMEDTRKNVEGTFLENAPILPVSAYTGQGIDQLKQEIVTLVKNAQERRTDRAFRMSVDRVFSVTGFGAVATGSVGEGNLKLGSEVCIYPQEGKARVRELQNHDIHTGQVRAGMRAAINLTGIEKDAIRKGCVIAQPGSMLRTRQMDVALQLTPKAAFSVKNNSKVHFYCGTTEAVARVKLLETDELLPGQKGYAQLKFDQDIIARNQDRFIIRFFSPVLTIGGGVILDMLAPRHRRRDGNVIAQLENRNSADLSRRVYQTILSAGCTPLSGNGLAILTNLADSETRSARTQLEQEGKILLLKSGYVAAAPMEQRRSETHELLKQFHRDHPIDPGMPLGELRGKVFQDCPESCDELIEYYVSKGAFRIGNGVAWLSGFRPKYSSSQDDMRKAIETLYEASGLDPLEDKLAMENFPAKRELYRQIAAAMCRDKKLIALNPQFAVHPKHYAKALELAQQVFREKGAITLGDFRDVIGIPRRRALLYLEYWDSQGMTRRVGDSRILFPNAKTE